MPATHSSRIASLDGIRAIAVTMVCLSHARPSPEGQGGWVALLIGSGELGVRIFFVLSGYLITHLLLAEQAAHGRIRLGRFFLRRSLRIFPAAFAYIATVAFLERSGYLELAQGDLFHALTYTMNYHGDRAWYLGHLWSLAVEEQFYLLWPLLLVLLPRQLVLPVLLIGLVLAPLTRVAQWTLIPGGAGQVDQNFHTVYDALATGALLAVIWKRWPVNVTGARAGTFALACLVLILVVDQYASAALFYSVGITALNVSIAFLICWATQNTSGPAGRWLNHPAMVWLGTISYSLYLWQQLVLPEAPDPTTGLALALAVATLSYLTLERPINGLRNRLRPVPHSGRAQGKLL